MHHILYEAFCFFYQPRPYRKVYSLPSSMSQMGLELQCSAEISDPGYNAAVSMTHLRTKTSYGFPTVLEHPNTNRKESLLLGSGGADKIKLFNEMLRKERSWSEGEILITDHNNESKVKRSHLSIWCHRSSADKIMTKNLNI